jgi:pyridoxal 5'-phosphate synthase pdxT subunit
VKSAPAPADPVGEREATPVRIGVLALQGAFREHRAALERSGAVVTEVRRPEHLAALHGLVIPGGESSTIVKLMRSYGLDAAIGAFAAAGGAVWGTCAGAIVVATHIDAYPDQPRLGLIDMAVARNAYGRQVASFEADVAVEPWDEPFRAVFIRAPRITSVGPSVEVLARHAGDPVAVASGAITATVFHPELSGDDRWHAAFVARCARVTRAERPPAA